MEMTKEQAIELLKEASVKNPGRWVEHSKRVAEAAKRIADKLTIDSEKAYILGYIHDIGKRFGINAQHTVKGYELLKELGYEEEYANICLTHSYLNNDINCTAGGCPNPEGYGYQLRKDFLKIHTYTIYEKIINICDLMCTNRFMTIEQRLMDIYLRRGVYENTVYHIKQTYKLKKELEEMMNCSIYSLFPEIIQDLNNLIEDKQFGVK